MSVNKYLKNFLVIFILLNNISIDIKADNKDNVTVKKESYIVIQEIISNLEDLNNEKYKEYVLSLENNSDFKNNLTKKQKEKIINDITLLKNNFIEKNIDFSNQDFKDKRNQLINDLNHIKNLNSANYLDKELNGGLFSNGLLKKFEKNEIENDKLQNKLNSITSRNDELEKNIKNQENRLDGKLVNGENDPNSITSRNDELENNIKKQENRLSDIKSDVDKLVAKKSTADGHIKELENKNNGVAKLVERQNIAENYIKKLENEKNGVAKLVERQNIADKLLNSIDDKIKSFNDNSDIKTNEFNTNVTDKTKSFNDNSDIKTNEFNTNVTDKTTKFNNNADSKTNEFDKNVADKTTKFNNNADSETTKFNINSSTKTTEFDTNASTKTTEFNNHVNNEKGRLTKVSDETIEELKTLKNKAKAESAIITKSLDDVIKYNNLLTQIKTIIGFDENNKAIEGFSLLNKFSKFEEKLENIIKLNPTLNPALVKQIEIDHATIEGLRLKLSDLENIINGKNNNNSVINRLNYLESEIYYSNTDNNGNKVSNIDLINKELTSIKANISKEYYNKSEVDKKIQQLNTINTDPKIISDIEKLSEENKSLKDKILYISAISGTALVFTAAYLLTYVKKIKKEINKQVKDIRKKQNQKVLKTA